MDGSSTKQHTLVAIIELKEKDSNFHQKQHPQIRYSKRDRVKEDKCENLEFFNPPAQISKHDQKSKTKKKNP